MSVSPDKRILNFPIVLVILILDLYLLIDGAAIFGITFNNFVPDIEIYLLMFAVIVGAARISMDRELNFRIGSTTVAFLPVFLLTTFAASFLPYQRLVFVNYDEVLSQLFFTIFFVAFVEEILFRVMFLNLFEKYGLKVQTAIVIQGILFGLFHYSNYSTIPNSLLANVLISIIFGLSLGTIFALIRKYNVSIAFGLIWGIHAGYDVGLQVGMHVLFGFL